MEEMVDIIIGSSIADVLTGWGVTCTCTETTVAPQLVNYKFVLEDTLDLPKLKKLMPILSAECQTKCTLDTSTGKGYHFQINADRDVRGTYTIYNSFYDISANKHTICIGRDSNNKPVLQTLDDITHLLIAGTTGSGKSVAVKSYICQLLTNKPEDLAMVLIDLKRTEFSQFANVPHLMYDVVTDIAKAELVLKALVKEMERRYYILEKLKLVDNSNRVFKPIVVCIDELANLLLCSEKCKELLILLLQKSRACSIHFILATQSPRASILSGLLLANVPSRLCLTCASYRESTLVINHGGAEYLSGKGDGIYKSATNPKEHRIQAPYISSNDIQKFIEG